MTVFVLSGLSVGVAGTFLCVLVAFFGDTGMHRRLLAFNAAVAVWGLGLFLSGQAEGPEQAHAAWLLAHSGGLFVAPTFLHLVCAFCGVDRRRIVIGGYLQAALFLGLFHYTSLALDQFRATPHGLFPVWSPTHLGAILGYGLFVGLAYRELFRFLPGVRGIWRTQALFLTYGFLVGFLGATTTFLPMFGMDAIPPWGNFGITLYCLLLTVAILKHSFLDLRVALRRGLAFSVAATLVLVLFVELVLSSSRLLSEIFGTGSQTTTWLLALMVGILVGPLTAQVSEAVDRLLPRGRYDYRAIIERNVGRLREAQRTAEICDALATAVDDALDPARLLVLELEDRHGGDHLVTMVRPGNDVEPRWEPLAISDTALTELAANGVLHLEPLAQDAMPALAGLRRQLEAQGAAEVVLSLVVDGGLRCALCLGVRRGQPLTHRDLDLLGTLLSQATVALRSVRLVEELERANAILGDEIRKKARAQGALQAAAEEWRSTFDATADVILTMDAEHRIMRANRAAAELLGEEITALPGLQLGPLLREAGWGDAGQRLVALIPQEGSAVHRLHLPAKDTWLAISFDSIEHDNGRRGMVCTLRDIGELERMEQTLQHERDDWAASFATINDAITVHDADFNIVRANPAAMEMLGLGLQRVLSQKCFLSYHGTACAPEGCPSCLTLVTAEPSTTEVFEPHLGKHIEIKALPRVDAEGRVYGLIHVVRDISQRKQAEAERALLFEQLLQAQKMESIGQLAGGVAHDFNNLLSVIRSCAELALLDAQPSTSVSDDLKTICDASEQAASLTGQLLALSRKQVLDMQSLDLGSVVGQMGTMLSRLIGERISMEIGAVPSPWLVRVDRTQIEQVVMNLVINARDAMPHGGTLNIRTHPVTLDGADASDHGGAPAGRYVRLMVTDTGTGMTDEVRSRLFEPFYTTKEKGKGTGLGMATLYAVVKQHEGYVALDTRLGVGTSFRIYLPGTEDQPAEPLEEPARTYQGEETILIVDDEPGVREVAGRTLRRLGYRVLTATSGKDALEIAAQHAGAVALLVTDVVMPGMAFSVYIERFEQEHPQTKMLFVSGYADEQLSRTGVLQRRGQFLQKPLSPSQLGARVRELLDQA